MCGIIGSFGDLPNRSKFIESRDKLNHRGPDDSGLYYNLEESVALGFKRLAIIDLEPRSNQPMQTEDKKVSLVFNGEIYNYKKLKRLLNQDFSFKTDSDTEVIIAAYYKWGIDCLEYLQGMFSIAIWDSERKKLFIARDRLGIKPLYYLQLNNTFYFSSEIKGILNFSKVHRVINKQGLLDYFSYRYALGDQTFYKDIKSLNPGTFLEIDYNLKIKHNRYWELPIIQNKNDPGEKTVLQELEQKLINTVEEHMMSDVPIGAYLSGGLDSSLLVALMSRLSDKPIDTFSIGFDKLGYDESKFATIVSKLYNTNHTELKMSGKDYFDLIDEVIAFKDEPLSIPNEIALHVLSKELKKNISVVISGEGADELFGGYGRIFRSGYDYDRSIKIDEFGIDNQNNLETLISNLMQKYGKVKFNDGLDHFLHQYTYVDKQEKINLFNKDYFRNYQKSIFNESHFKKIFDEIESLNTTEKYLYCFQKIHLQGPLRRLDSSTMSKSVEARVPFVDHKLVEYVNALPNRYKLRWKSKNSKKLSLFLNSNQISENHDITKYALREIAKKFLPKSITDRKKIGFPVPLNQWVDEKYEVFLHDMLLSKNSLSKELYDSKNLEIWIKNIGKNKNYSGYNAWMMINIELWMKKYEISL